MRSAGGAEKMHVVKDVGCCEEVGCREEVRCREEVGCCEEDAVISGYLTIRITCSTCYLK